MRRFRTFNFDQATDDNGKAYSINARARRFLSMHDQLTLSSCLLLRTLNGGYHRKYMTAEGEKAKLSTLNYLELMQHLMFTAHYQRKSEC